MKYISTRGEDPPISFSAAVVEGLARDGGLLLPETIPDVRDSLDTWRHLSYAELAVKVMHPFTDFSEERLKDLVERSVASFRHPEVTPLRPCGDMWILELFHGPTLAFKDVALQFLGNVFESILEEQDATMNIVGATSGDTGSAAICGVQGKKRLRIFMLHPDGRTSLLQRKQMTTVQDEHVHNLAVSGTFDDCQGMVKTLFNDLAFRDQVSLGAVNSINWARVMAQIVYYAYASLQITSKTGASRVRFSVPTGNFGDIFAGWIARRMGFPIGRLILATNTNDILTRFFTSGEYRMAEVVPTISPSMDIQIASNFERYLYYRLNECGTSVRTCMHDVAAGHSLKLPLLSDGHVDDEIEAISASEQDTLESMRKVYQEQGYLLDPHTAVGVHAAKECNKRDQHEPIVCLATAHPAKFPEAVAMALGASVEARHPVLDAISEQPERYDPMVIDADVLKAYVLDRAREGMA